MTPTTRRAAGLLAAGALAVAAVGVWFSLRPEGRVAAATAADARRTADSEGTGAELTPEDLVSRTTLKAGQGCDAGADVRAYQEELRRRVRLARPINPAAPGSVEGRSAVLESTDGFPLFEAMPGGYLNHVLNPGSLAPFRQERPVPRGAAWLKSRGIDVLFVPVPKMTEVYPEHFASPCPKDYVVAPHVRHLLAELAADGVEVIDLLPLFLAERYKAAAPLYQSADPHWSPRGQALGARAVAARLLRYDWAARAQAAPPAWSLVPQPFYPFAEAVAVPALTPEQRARAEQAWPRVNPRITHPDGSLFFSPESPVVLIGDSYNHGYAELLGRELNLPVCPLFTAGSSSQQFKGFLRDPALLAHCKVVVWLVCNSTLTMPWPLPAPVTGELHLAGRP